MARNWETRNRDKTNSPKAYSSVQAFNSLMGRALDRPKEQTDENNCTV